MTRLTILVLVCVIAVAASPLGPRTSAFAQPKQTAIAPKIEQSVPKPELKSAKPEGREKKKEEGAGARAQGQPYGYWIATRGGFHTAGPWARGIYQWADFYDTNWTYVDNRDVGGQSGWTYKENGFDFYVFFPEHYPGPAGCAWGTLMSSFNNDWFEPFACIQRPD
jgi:hypothetical protein